MKSTLFYNMVRPIVFIYLKIVSNIKIINQENIPKKGKVILAGNHTNDYDSLLLVYTLKRGARFIAKKELLEGIKGMVFKMMGIIPVDRSSSDPSVVPAAVKYLDIGSAIIIFPEGTINKTDDIIMPFKKGAVIMAIQSQSPIVPFAIKGSYNKKDKLTIKLGKKYYLKSNDVDQEIKILEQKVINLLKEDNEVKK